VREESHLDDMRDAIRGDFERLAERRGEQDLLRVAAPEEAPGDPEPEPLTEPPKTEFDEEADTASEAEPRSWLARLFSP
jgi:hypothetical protein